MSGPSVELRMQKAAEERLDAADRQMDAWDAGEEELEEAVQLAGAYCGCQVCIVREVLDAAVPLLLDAIASGEFVMADTHHFLGRP